MQNLEIKNLVITKFKIKIIEQTFRSSMFSFEICCLKILILFKLQKVCDEKKSVSACNRQKLNGCNPKNDVDRYFFARALHVCTMVQKRSFS